jgi:hypothetical protein
MEQTSAHHLPEMAIPEDETDEAVARRCYVLRICVKPELNQRQFAKWLGVSAPRWNNVETGELSLGRDLAMMLVRKIPTLTLDYLYRGRYAGLHFELVKCLSEAEEKAKTA